MASFPPALQALINELSKLPSIGERSATRLAYHLVTSNRELAANLAGAISAAMEKTRLCTQCYFLSEQELCAICSNSSRDQALLCIVEKPVDVLAVERIGEFRGVYHVLHGLWAPLKGLGPDDIRLKELIGRLKIGSFREAIIATASTVEGDATAVYLAKILAEHGVRSTRPAQGMPKGGELEYADEVTLSRAFAGRNVIGF
ncbi:MAG: recombination protein RecR [Proteobacteria bacterium]|nr:MAG: recombination protein RecR [Pseudomonadota bacterium]